MEPGREPAEVQAYRKLLTASSEHFNILRSAPAFSHDEHWDTQYQKVRKDTRDDTDERARLHRDGGYVRGCGAEHGGVVSLAA